VEHHGRINEFIMPLSFPNSPTVGESSVQNGRTYTWDGYAWNLAGSDTKHASTHGPSGSDPIAIDGSQVTTGTVADDRLSDTLNTTLNLYLWANFR
jgi:hypothetical protein